MFAKKKYLFFFFFLLFLPFFFNIGVAQEEDKEKVVSAYWNVVTIDRNWLNIQLDDTDPSTQNLLKSQSGIFSISIANKSFLSFEDKGKLSVIEDGKVYYFRQAIMEFDLVASLRPEVSNIYRYSYTSDSPRIVHIAKYESRRIGDSASRWSSTGKVNYRSIERRFSIDHIAISNFQNQLYSGYIPVLLTVDPEFSYLEDGVKETRYGYTIQIQKPFLTADIRAMELLNINEVTTATRQIFTSKNFNVQSLSVGSGRLYSSVHSYISARTSSPRDTFSWQQIQSRRSFGGTLGDHFDNPYLNIRDDGTLNIYERPNSVRVGEQVTFKTPLDIQPAVSLQRNTATWRSGRFWWEYGFWADYGVRDTTSNTESYVVEVRTEQFELRRRFQVSMNFLFTAELSIIVDTADNPPFMITPDDLDDLFNIDQSDVPERETPEEEKDDLESYLFLINVYILFSIIVISALIIVLLIKSSRTRKIEKAILTQYDLDPKLLSRKKSKKRIEQRTIPIVASSDSKKKS